MDISFNKNKQSHFLYVSAILLVVILAYWQISFLKYSVTHDMINCWIPWRYFISNCIQNGSFPFWNPYQQLGYPIHADLQGPTWYLESIILSLFTEQNNVIVQRLFIFYVFIAGTGMYFLSHYFQKNKSIAFAIGVSYMLSGFFVSHVQHFYAIIGAAWIPFIILNYYKMLYEKQYIYGVYASIFMFFNITGGNHTFSIILLYFFILLSSYFIYLSILKKEKNELYEYIKLNLLFAFCTIILSTVVLIAFFQTAPYIERLAGLSFKEASINPLSPQSLLSLLFPFSTVNSVDFYNTDPSMSNIYIGIASFLFIIFILINKKKLLDKYLLSFAIICLILSFGSYTPIYKFAFDYLPLINRFRFPSYFSLFSLILFLILIGNQLASLSASQINFKKTKLSLIILAGVIFICIVFAFNKNNNNPLFFIKHFETIFDFLNASSFYQNIILQGIIHLFLISLLIILLSIPFRKYWLSATIVLIIIDLFISVQLNLAYVGMSRTNPIELKEYLSTLPKEFPIPNNDKIIDNTESLGQNHGLYRNTSGFHKRISADIFNSYAFKNQIKLIDSFPILYNNMLSNPLLYFSSNICNKNSINLSDTNTVNHNTIVLKSEDFKIIQNKVENTKNLNDSLQIISYLPTKIIANTYSNTSQLLTFLQSNYYGWRAFIDGNETNIITSNFLTMSILLPKGEHEIIFEYKNKPIIIGAFVSYSTFLFLLFIVIKNFIKK